MSAKPSAIGELCAGIFDGPHATPQLFDEGKAVFLGIREITADGHLCGSPASLRAAINRLASNKRRRQRHCAGGRQTQKGFEI